MSDRDQVDVDEVERISSGLRDRGLMVTIDGRTDSAGAAAMIGVAIGTFRNWRAAGVGPRSNQIRGRHWYSIADVSAWIKTQALRRDEE